MRYIDNSEIRPDLPLRWNEIISRARIAVAKEMKKAKAKAKLDGKTAAECREADCKARNKAIGARSRVWRLLNKRFSEQSFGKCWYCQSKDIRSHKPLDHYRPKSSVIECPDHPGYWWLAFSWENYRFSCTFCNSYHEKEASIAGKQDHFPIDNPPNWQRLPGQTNIEEPLLLDPCRLGDYKLITYDARGQIVVNKNIAIGGSFEERKAKKSIEIYDFNHEPTRRKRETIYFAIEKLIDEVNDLISDGYAKNRDKITDKQSELIKRARSDSREYDFNEASYTYLKGFRRKNPWVEDIIDCVR